MVWRYSIRDPTPSTIAARINIAMLWSSWTSLVPSLYIAAAILSWYFTEFKINLIAAVGALSFCWAVAPGFSHEWITTPYPSVFDAFVSLHIEMFVFDNTNMILTGAAVVWLCRRAWQTLWKPVPDLINILGVEVPDPPDVCLAGIRSDAATVNWTRPSTNRPVHKFLIQVNGVVGKLMGHAHDAHLLGGETLTRSIVGEVAASQEAAIVVSGLKPNHFYNVRVIAVGFNSFQAGSRVIRLRTHGENGQPQLDGGRIPTGFLGEDQQSEGDSSGVISRSPVLALESTAVEASVALSTNEQNLSAHARRNTVVRRQSPSTTSLEKHTSREEITAHTEKTLLELTEEFESLRRETEEMQSLISKDECDYRRLLDELEGEKKDKKDIHKKKEEQTELLKREVNSTERNMRLTMQRKAQKERLLKEKQAERFKYQGCIARWEEEIYNMRKDLESLEQKRKDVELQNQKRAEQLRFSISEAQNDCARLEAELKEKRNHVKGLANARKRLLGGEEEEKAWSEKNAEGCRDRMWRMSLLNERFAIEYSKGMKLDEQLRLLSMQIQQIPAANLGLCNQADTSGIEMEKSSTRQHRRRSGTNNSLSRLPISSPLPAYSQIDPALLAPVGFASARSANPPPGLTSGPLFDQGANLPARLDAAAYRAGLRLPCAPLSPSATALLPSDILRDDEDNEYNEASLHAILSQESFPPQHADSLEKENGPLSPASSSQSLSLLSSPRGSSQRLSCSPFKPDGTERRERTGPPTSPVPLDASSNQPGAMFSLQRPKLEEVADSGPPLGSLEQSQSHSFPRQTEDPDGLGNKRRGSILGTLNVFNRGPAGPDLLDGHASHSRMFSSRSLNIFSGANRHVAGTFPRREGCSPKSASIDLLEFSRPSKDGSSIWGPPEAASMLPNTPHFWSPDAPWSGTHSRRPSVHGSPSALKTTLASAEDEILRDDPLPNAHRVGVIGQPSGAPPKAKTALGQLNPAAPAFIASLFRSKSEKEKDRDTGREKEKTKAKDKGQVSNAKKSKEAAGESAGTAMVSQNLESESPSDRRVSRDSASIRTETSVSESRQSLSFERFASSTSSEPAVLMAQAAGREDNVVRKLFRKSSSAKYSPLGRLGGKKGPGSAASMANSDKGLAQERTSLGDLSDIGDEMLPASSAGRGHDSATSSPNLGSMSGGSRGKEGRTSSRWLASFGRKAKRDKEKESLDLDRFQASEPDDLGEDGTKARAWS